MTIATYNVVFYKLFNVVYLSSKEKVIQFCFMYFRIWIIIFLSLKTGKICVVNDTDQTVVMLRPKYYIGSSGSVWSSDYMFLRYTFETAVVIFFLSFNIKDTILKKNHSLPYL